MNSKILILCALLSALACRSTKPQNALKDEAGESASGLGLRPVFTYYEGGMADGTLRDVLLKAVNRSAKSALSSLFASITGADHKLGLGLLANAIKRFDDALAAEVASGPLHDAILASQNPATIEMQLFLIDQGTPIPADATVGTLATAQEGLTKELGAILQLAAPRMSADGFETLAERVASFSNTPVLRPERAWEFTRGNYQAYRRIAAQQRDKWVVMLAKLGLHIDGKMMMMTLDTRVKPSVGSQRVGQNTGVVGISVLDYVPGLAASTDEPAVAQFGITRLYRSDTPAGGVVGKLRFGRLLTQDLMTILQCMSNCQEEAKVGQIGRYYPTIRGYFRPESFGEAGYGALDASMQVIARAFSEWNHVNILLRSIGIDLSDPAQPRVSPENSSFAIVLGEGDDSIVLSRESNVQFAGFDLYNGFLASQIADRLTDNVREQLADQNQAAADAVARQLAGFVRLFDSR